MSGVALVKGLITRFKGSEALRRVVVPLMLRFPRLRRRLVALANVSAASTRDITHPDWPAPLPAAYLHLPPATRKVLLDLARAGGHAAARTRSDAE